MFCDAANRLYTNTNRNRLEDQLAAKGEENLYTLAENPGECGDFVCECLGSTVERRSVSLRQRCGDCRKSYPRRTLDIGADVTANQNPP